MRAQCLANQKSALTCHALTLFSHTETLQLLLLVGELFGAHTSCPEEKGEEFSCFLSLEMTGF